jgi:hypothetical protein
VTGSSDVVGLRRERYRTVRNAAARRYRTRQAGLFPVILGHPIVRRSVPVRAGAPAPIAAIRAHSRPETTRRTKRLAFVEAAVDLVESETDKLMFSE